MFKRLFGVIHAALTDKPESPQAPASDRGDTMWVMEQGDLLSSNLERADPSPSREQIAIHAYHRWMTRGKPIGTDLEDWFEAERELTPRT